MVIPAILETDPEAMIGRMEELSRFAKLLHVDVVDGEFVAANNLNVLKTLATYKSPVDLELHLMVKEPGKLFSDVRKVKKIKRIVLQIESDWRHAFKKFKRICQVGIGLRPETSLSTLFDLPLKIRGTKGVMKLKAHNSPNPPYLKRGIHTPDFFLLLSITPGAQGNPFRPAVYKRVKEVRKLFPRIPIEIDGAMNPLRIKKLKVLGAKDFVVGSYLKTDDINKRWRELKRVSDS